MDDTFIMTKAMNIDLDSLVDLEGDEYADPTGEDPDWQFEYAQVIAWERESPGCIRIDFTNGQSVGFPPSHMLKVVSP